MQAGGHRFDPGQLHCLWFHQNESSLGPPPRTPVREGRRGTASALFGGSSLKTEYGSVLQCQHGRVRSRAWAGWHVDDRLWRDTVVSRLQPRKRRWKTSARPVADELLRRTPVSSHDACLRDIGQARKGAWWMPRDWEAMKDVDSCDKLRGAANRH